MHKKWEPALAQGAFSRDTGELDVSTLVYQLSDVISSDIAFNNLILPKWT